MKILSTEQIRAWDQYTIQHEPITSVNLMERAAAKCVEWLEQNNYTEKSFDIFCGKGNNGGDGLAIARMLIQGGSAVTVYILEFGHKGTEDFQVNLERLHKLPSAAIHFIQDESNFHHLNSDHIIIDALFGSGLSRPLEGVTKKLVEFMNNSGCTIIAVDMPSGLSVDRSSKGNTTVKANHTLSFQCYKPAFLVAENAVSAGRVHILDIGLHNDYYHSLSTKFELTDDELAFSVYKPRNPFAHKGNFGHALIAAGSYGKIGAAVLAAKACLRSGVGLLTCHTPRCGYEILQTSVPEAMVTTDFNSSVITKIEEDVSKYNSIGIGPGIGTAAETRNFLKELFSVYHKPVVIDADALNGLAMQKELLASIPANSILTPHPKEFERLFGKCENDFERTEMALQNAQLINCVIVVKGHYTFIATPGGRGYFNSTGNAGMATGGSGDVLTGILTGLLAQGYASEQAAILGVYLHGLAGDFAAKEKSEEALVAGDIINFIGAGFQFIQSLQ